MSSNIFNRFNENEKWKDYYNPKSFEVKMAFFSTLLFVILTLIIDLYDNFSLYLTPFQNASLYIAQAMIGMVGVIIAGVAIIVSVFNKNLIEIIEKVNGEAKVIEKTLISFEFLAFNIGIGITLFLLIHFALYSTYSLVPKFVFYLLLFLFIYFLLFIVFYSISLISNIVRLFHISNIYNKIIEKDKDIYTVANEIRIDFIFNSLLNESITKEEFLLKLNEHVEASNIRNKTDVKEYFKKYYS